jgi:glucans biosynthesis protein C
MTNATAPATGRLYYLDWLKFLVVLSLAPFHAAISFTGVGSVYVYDTPVRNILLAGAQPSGVGPLAMTIFTVFMDNWFMHLLFFVSGISVVYSLRKRNGGQFMLERLNKLGLPLLIAIFLLVPIPTWLGAVSFGTYTGSFWSFYPAFFGFPSAGSHVAGFFNDGQFWFLRYLLVFCALALPLLIAIKRKGEDSRILAVARRFINLPLILLPALWFALMEGLFRPGWPGSLTLISDWAVVTVNLSFFLIGYIAGSTPELLQAIEKHRLALLILGVGAHLCRITVYYLVPVPNGYNPANILAQVLRGLAAYGLVLAATGYGQRYLNRSGRLLGIARDLSLPLYFLHYIPVTVVIYLLLNSGLSIWLRWLIAVVAAWVSVALFTLVARYIPVIRDFFGIRKPTAKISEN